MDSKQLIQKFNISANKSLGQNFLHRDDILDDIASAAFGVTDTAIEIGAGLGVLSKRLCDGFRSVTTVEIDKSLKEVTDFSLIGCNNHTMVYADFLRVNFKELCGGKKVTVVGNLPYYITSDILKKLIKNREYIERAVIMIQKEAADKLIAAPGNKNYRAISVMTGCVCKVTKLFDVSPDCFIPAPHVTSSVVVLDFNHTKIENEFFEFVNTVFCARRKKLTSVLKDQTQKQNAIKTLEQLGFLPSTRAEQLSPKQIYEIFCNLTK